MIENVIFSEDMPPVDWSETQQLKLEFGPKAAGLAALPRPWTLPFALISAKTFTGGPSGRRVQVKVDNDVLQRLQTLGHVTNRPYVRSSIIGETIWDRGKYKSVIADTNAANFEAAFRTAVEQVLDSAPGKQVGLVIQSYFDPHARGEFGNLLRVSKTRDHWELSSYSGDTTSRVRLNTQRDQAANPLDRLEIKRGLARERLFGSIAAWLNTYLLGGCSQRINCEWINDQSCFHLVQVDEEDEDVLGLNPFQLRIVPIHHRAADHGRFLQVADETAQKTWDKLSVLAELWEPTAAGKPTLLYVPLSQLPRKGDPAGLADLEADFQKLIGPDNVVVRTSVRANAEKILNLPRTDGLSPASAALWCLEVRDKIGCEQGAIDDFAFVAHRFIAARAAAWVRAQPENPVIEINSLWGLPDALSYCPYDIWEVHLPTKVATEYPDYKSHMMVARDDGRWEQVRVKNELARSLSVGRREAIDLAIRSAAIAQRLNQACHIMWFVGCTDHNGSQFSIPWYWSEAHSTDKNVDRYSYQEIIIRTPAELEEFRSRPRSEARVAIALMPTDQELMRDPKFVCAVGATARGLRIPVILAGSTLAHAYFHLTREGCAVVTRGEKDHSRIRRSASFGKIVRDRIPRRIAERMEAEVTSKTSGGVKKAFLTSKLVEEALEVRNAETKDDKRTELADVYELVRALAHLEGLSIEEVIAAAEEKRLKAGGFDEGIVLLQTGILGPTGNLKSFRDGLSPQVLARKVSDDSYELPLTIFGFMDMDQPHSLEFGTFGIRLQVTLRSDRIGLQVSRDVEQLELPLDQTVVEVEDPGG